MMNTEDQIATVQSWMKDVSASLGVDLQLDEEGLCSFEVGDDTIIVIEVPRDLPVVHFYSPLIPLPADDTTAATALMI